MVIDEHVDFLEVVCTQNQRGINQVSVKAYPPLTFRAEEAECFLVLFGVFVRHVGHILNDRSQLVAYNKIVRNLLQSMGPP
jgi:hypothetical protein